MKMVLTLVEDFLEGLIKDPNIAHLDCFNRVINFPSQSLFLLPKTTEGIRSALVLLAGFAYDLNADMDKIMVVPNPYVATNMMETALSNSNLNQRRRILFTHIPATCTIKIYTSSGVFVDQVDVDNPSSMGITHWDMLTHENLEIAAGIYIYHVKSEVTGKEKIGKFAVIK